MKLDLEKVYVASYDMNGGFWTEPATEYLKRAVEAFNAGTGPTRFPLALCDGMLQALRVVKAARAARKDRVERGQAEQAQGTTYREGN